MKPVKITMRVEEPDGTFSEVTINAPDEVGMWLTEKLISWKSSFVFTVNEINSYNKKLTKRKCNNPK